MRQLPSVCEFSLLLSLCLPLSSPWLPSVCDRSLTAAEMLAGLDFA